MWKSKEGTGAYNWKGDAVGYTRLHKWIREHKPKPELCGLCGLKPPFDVANISGKYLRDINDFQWLCRLCHQESDGRLKRLKRGLRDCFDKYKKDVPFKLTGYLKSSTNPNDKIV